MKQTSFSPICDTCASEMDQLTLAKDYDTLASYVIQQEEKYAENNDLEYAPIFFYIGTGNSTLAHHYHRSASSDEQGLSIVYRKKALFYFRKAISLLESSDDTPAILLPIYTNYANVLDSCGRVIEALRIYRKALSITDSFGMAIANYGRALGFYADMVNDPGHYRELHCHAYQAIKKALEIKDANMHAEAVALFEKQIEDYEKRFNHNILSAPIIYPEHDLGAYDEKAYRSWCLHNHLFLNPLNDLMVPEAAFAHDPLTITQYTEYVHWDEVDEKSSGNPPKWFAMLNQLKEEYIYARFLCYEGTEKMAETHYADRDVLLSLANYDYVNYSIRLEQLKSAFRISYSLFDQIAFMINEFWSLGLGERQADAYHVFDRKHYPTDNIALTALFWAFNEFKEEYIEGAGASEKELRTLRHALEHKFVQVHEHPRPNELHIMDDRFYHISESNLKEHTLRILTLAREWIIELVYAIAIEERKNQDKENAIHLHIADYDDQWKL